MSAPHMGHKFKTYTAEQLRKWIRSICDDSATELRDNNAPGGAACIASMMAQAGTGGMPNYNIFQ